MKKWAEKFFEVATTKATGRKYYATINLEMKPHLFIMYLSVDRRPKELQVQKMVERASVMIERARSAQDLDSTAQLFAAYANSLGLDLSFQEFDDELKSLPGKYHPPTGEILLAHDCIGTAVGCVAVRRLFPPDCCETERLYILPTGRVFGVGKKLLYEVLDIAASMGYNEIELDTLPSMSQAISFYESADFAPTTSCYKTPLTGTVFLARRLEEISATAGSTDVSGLLTSGDCWEM